MKLSDILLETKAVMAESDSLQKMFDNTKKEIELLTQGTQEVDNYDEKLQSLVNRQEFILGLMEQNTLRMRQLMTTAYGEKGGKIFDAIVRSVLAKHAKREKGS